MLYITVLYVGMPWSFPLDRGNLRKPMRYIPTDQEVLAALWVLVRELKLGAGRMAQLKSPAVKEARRLLSLHSVGGTWKETRATWQRLGAAGLDAQKFLMVDEAAFQQMRAYLAATPKEQHKKQQADLAAEIEQWPMADTRLKPKVTEGLRCISEQSEPADGQEPSANPVIIKITDRVMNPEFEAEAKARRDACCINHSKPQPARSSGVGKPGLADDRP